MTRTATLAAFGLALALPALAQDADPPPRDEPGMSLMEEGARLFFRGLLQEMEPALEGLEGLADDMRPALRDFAEQMGPALRDLMTEIEDWSDYHPPEILPNGDIIIRRRLPGEDSMGEGGEIEL